MEDVLRNKTALFSPHLKWVLSVLISVLPVVLFKLYFACSLY